MSRPEKLNRSQLSDQVCAGVLTVVMCFLSQRSNDLLATSKFNQEAKAAKPHLLPNVEVLAPLYKAGRGLLWP